MGYLGKSVVAVGTARIGPPWLKQKVRAAGDGLREGTAPVAIIGLWLLLEVEGHSGTWTLIGLLW